MKVSKEAHLLGSEVRTYRRSPTSQQGRAQTTWKVRNSMANFSILARCSRSKPVNRFLVLHGLKSELERQREMNSSAGNAVPDQNAVNNTETSLRKS
jgi:hypothetical protein